jgi:Sulfotransferase family
MASHSSGTSSGWLTILSCFFGATGSSEHWPVGRIALSPGGSGHPIDGNGDLQHNWLRSLLFETRIENNAMVRSFGLLKARLSKDGKKEENCASGEPQPDFLCVGSQKGGTSWLYHQLAQHPDFWMPPIKEIHYFDKLSRKKRLFPPRRKDERDVCFLESMNNLSARPYIDLENYGRLFIHKGARLSGDISPGYSTLSEEIIQRIVNYFPTLKVIFLARDPVERAWSQLSMGVRLGRISRFNVTDIDEVIRNLQSPVVSSRSYPSKIVARWRLHVQPNLFCLYFFDDLEKNPTELRRSILHFLGADANKPSGRLNADDKRNAGKEKLQLTDKVRSGVAHFFKDELLACARELGGPAKGWPARYGFSLLWCFIGLADDLDLPFWCDRLI